MTVADALALALPGTAERRDLRWILAHVLRTAGPLGLPSERILIAEEERQFRELISRRRRGEPVQYLLGEWEFFGRRFLVDRRALIPRPETELVIELALKLSPDARRILDLGTGSGVLAATLTAELPASGCLALDLDLGALSLAKQNIRLLGLGDRVALAAADWTTCLAGPPFDLAVSNPPYVDENEREGLDACVRDFEPSRALFSADGGLTDIRKLLDGVPAVLGANGIFLFEFGFGQRPAIAREIAARPHWDLLEIADDLAGIPRVAALRRR